MIAAAALLVATACSSPANHQATPVSSTSTISTTLAAPKDLAAAIAAAQEKADRHASGDFAGEWLLFTQDLRNHIAQEAFVQYSQTCSPVGGSNAGLKIKVTGGRMDGDDRAVVRQELLGVVKTANMVYENGGWYKEPDDFLASNFGKTGPELIAADRAQGHCRG